MGTGNSGEWFTWLCENFYRHAGLLVDKPAWLEGRDVYLADGSEVVMGGSEKTFGVVPGGDRFRLSMNG